MNVQQLRYFVAASDFGSFRKAGAALGVQESTISRRIRDLEDDLGSALFRRHSGGVCLTIAGQRLLSRARKVLRYVSEGAEIVGAVGRVKDGHLRVGIYTSLASGFLLELLKSFGEQHGGVQLEIADGNPAEHVAAIRQFRLDIAFLTGTHDWPECETAHLWNERVFVVLPQGHTLAQKDEVIWSEIAHENFIVSDAPPGQEIHDYLVKRVGDLGRHPEIQTQFVGRDNLMPLVALGRGLTVTSEATTAAHVPGICYRPLVGEILPFSAVWSPKNDNPALRRFVSMAKSQARRRV
ncbi:LysR family transcriptional regulator [Caenibius tardaugens]|nr:LysR family transcriptional regulator [Caenibius tardaugens]AZI35832.1 LysR family transcriptional regulator [Caenibius tardaugens NBRC 16725]